mgnify:CR=1 FL=1
MKVKAPFTAVMIASIVAAVMLIAVPRGGFAEDHKGHDHEKSEENTKNDLVDTAVSAGQFNTLTSLLQKADLV